MRIVVTAAALFALAATPAMGQLFGGGGEQQKTRYTEQEKKLEAERERQYQNTIRRAGPSSQTSGKSDPWGNVRGLEEPQRNNRR